MSAAQQKRCANKLCKEQRHLSSNSDRQQGDDTAKRSSAALEMHSQGASRHKGGSSHSDEQPEPESCAPAAINVDPEACGGRAGDQAVVNINPANQHGGQLVEGESVQVKVVAFTVSAGSTLGACVCHHDCHTSRARAAALQCQEQQFRATILGFRP